MKSVLIKVKTLLALLLLIPSLSWGEFENLNEDISVIGKKLICFNNSTGSVFGLDFKNGIPKDGREIGFLDFAYMNENHSSLDKFFTLYYQADFSFIQFEIPYDSSDNKLLELPQFAMSLDRNRTTE